MNEFNSDLPSTSDAADNTANGVQDPSSISLFSTGPETGVEKTLSVPSPSASNSAGSAHTNSADGVLKPPDGHAIPASMSSAFTSTVTKKALDSSKREGDKSSTKKQQSYTSYVAGKATEVAKRRNLNERIGRLQSKHGILFNVPQCQTITLNQLAIFLRRLRKSTDVRALMSSELMLKIFQEDAEIPPKVTSQQSQTQSHHNHPAVISVNEVLGSDDETRQRDDEDEATEPSSDSDMETDLENPTTSRAGEHNSYDPYRYYKERMEILAADARALALHRRLSDMQQKVRQAFATLPQDFIFGAMPNGSSEDPTVTCARCRPLLNRPTRELTNFNLAGKRIRKPRMMTSDVVCNVMEYSAVDDSIHPSLSLSSAIPMERKVHKYLQVVGTLPAEVERRRLKTAQLAYKKDDKVLRSFRYTEEQGAQVEGVVEEEPSAISLKIKKKIPRAPKAEKAESLMDEEWQSTDDGGLLDTDTEDTEYPVVQKPRKRKESMHTAHKKSFISESRRPSVHAASSHDFGLSVFDYDPSFMDIGLTAVQNVDQPEIAIPLFRKKDLLDRSLKRPCSMCTNTEDAWADITKMHTELEYQERHRFKGIIHPARTKP